MAQTVTPTIADVCTDLITFIASVVPAGTQIVRGLANRVPAPLPQTGFVVITPIFQGRLAYNEDTFAVPSGDDPPTALSVKMSTRVDIQIDVYGPTSGSWAAMLATLWRDDYACNLMENCQPLYMDEARMIPLVDSEQQYEERWSLVATAQYNPVVTPVQTFGDTAQIDLVNVQEQYPA